MIDVASKHHNSIRALEVRHDDEGMRLDRFLRRSLNTSQGYLQKLWRKKKIITPDHIQSLSTPVRHYDLIHVVCHHNFDTSPQKKREQHDSPPKNLYTRFEKALVGCYGHTLCIKKWYGIASQGGYGLGGRHIAALSTHWARMHGYDTAYMVHRLDKHTSGLMLIALTRQEAVTLSDHLAHRRLKKCYYALVRGRPSDHGVYDSPLHRRGKQQEARTSYTFVKHNHGLSLVSIQLHTGRFHQIRKHCALNGHPIVGDPIHDLHADKESRCYLHAYALAWDSHHITTSVPETFIQRLEDTRLDEKNFRKSVAHA